MAAPYSLDLRRKILDAYLNEEGSMRKIAERFGVSLWFVYNLLKRYRKENTIEPRKHKSGNHPKVLPKHVPFLKKLIEKENDLTLREICSRFEEEFSIIVSVSSMNESLKRLGISRKKKPSTTPKNTKPKTWRNGSTTAGSL